MAILGEKEFLGEMAMILDKPHSSLAMALTEVTAAKLTKDQVSKILTSGPPWLSKMLHLSIERLNKVNDIIKRNNVVDDSLNERIKNLMSKIEEEAPADNKTQEESPADAKAEAPTAKAN